MRRLAGPPTRPSTAIVCSRSATTSVANPRVVEIGGVPAAPRPTDALYGAGQAFTSGVPGTPRGSLWVTGGYHDGELYAAGDFTGPSPVRASNPKASRRVWLGPTRRRMRTWLSGTVSPLSGLLVTLQYLASLITPEFKTLRSCLSSGSESCSDWMALSPKILLLTSRRRRGRSINRSFCESSCGVVAASQTGSKCTSPLLD